MDNKTVVRFAPSPTGQLHLGGARTALFNWLYARSRGGKILLRLEDTDQQRSLAEYSTAIINDLNWLGLDFDAEITFQSHRSARHQQVARQLLQQGQAYYCIADDLSFSNSGYPQRSPWRDRTAAELPAGARPVVRLRAPVQGSTDINDLVQGEISSDNRQLDDLVLLRSDGSPTYMLAVVVDDHDQEISHVIRGSDHLTNTFRQLAIYRAMGWQPPQFAHLPLIVAPSGKKLSKRDAAAGLADLRRRGYLPQAVANALLRLGWGYRDTEIISMAETLKIFELQQIGKSAAVFDPAKLDRLNQHYLQTTSPEIVWDLFQRHLPSSLTAKQLTRVKSLLPAVLKRSVNLSAAVEQASFVWQRPTPDSCTEQAKSVIDQADPALWHLLLATLNDEQPMLFLRQAIDLPGAEKEEGKKDGKTLTFRECAQLLRAVLTGTLAAPDLSLIIAALGRDESIIRLQSACKSFRPEITGREH